MSKLLSNLLVMQSDLRHWDDIQSMIEYVKDGGFWTAEYLASYAKEKNLTRISPLISVSSFEDDSDFVHDGHHRCVATWLGGRDFLRDDEFNLSKWEYKDYLEIAPENNWYTPFNPKTHVRTADFAAFKKEARDRFQQDANAALDWLYNNFQQFRTPRTIHTVPELAKLFSLRKTNLEDIDR